MLSPEELVEIAESVSGMLLLVFALLFKRKLPSEQQTQLAQGTRKFLLLCAPGTLDAAGEQLQEHRELARALSPGGFIGGLIAHLVQRGSALEKRDPDEDEIDDPPRNARATWVEPKPVDPRPMNERPEVWKPTRKTQSASSAESVDMRAPIPGRFQPPPGVEFGQRKVPRVPVFDGNGPVARA